MNVDEAKKQALVERIVTLQGKVAKLDDYIERLSETLKLINREKKCFSDGLDLYVDITSACNNDISIGTAVDYLSDGYSRVRHNFEYDMGMMKDFIRKYEDDLNNATSERAIILGEIGQIELILKSMQDENE